MILRLAGEDSRDQPQGPSRPCGALVVIELVPGDGLNQPVHPQPALRRGRDQASAGQGTHRLRPLQAITQPPGQDRASLRRPRGENLQVDVIRIKNRAQPQQLNGGRAVTGQPPESQKPGPGHTRRVLTRVQALVAQPARQPRVTVWRPGSG